MPVTMTMSDMTSGPDGGDQTAAPTRGPRASRPKRRTFPPAYKLAIVEQYDRLTDPRERGALLRREGLYHSHIEYWRETLQKASLTALSDKPTGRPSPSPADVKNDRLQKENDKLRAELARTKAALGVLGKAHELLEMLSESADSGARQSK